MDAERLAELRQLLARHRHFVELHGGGECGIHRELRDAYDDLSHEMVKSALDLLDTAEREAVLREALSSVLTVIDGDYGINGKTSLCVRAAEVLLEQGGGE